MKKKSKKDCKWVGNARHIPVSYAPIRISESEIFSVSLTLHINTVGGKDMAKRVFSNVVRSDPHHPLLHLKVKKINAPRPTKRSRLDKK